MSETIVWSYGGGTQSVAIAVLIDQKKLPVPDYIVFADTGREASETMDYYQKYVSPMFRSWGRELLVASHKLSTVDLVSSNGQLLIPAFTQRGKMHTYCSVEWKQRVVRRLVRSLGVASAIDWVGMSLDEVDRMRVSDVKWFQNHYPLVFDVPKRRFECKKLVEDYGLPTPPKSACWMCPNRSDAEWLHLRENYPADFEKACKRDERCYLSHGARLHETRLPLGRVDFQASKELPLFSQCQGLCFV